MCGRDAERLKEAPRGICRDKNDAYLRAQSSSLPPLPRTTFRKRAFWNELRRRVEDKDYTESGFNGAFYLARAKIRKAGGYSALSPPQSVHYCIRFRPKRAPVRFLDDRVRGEMANVWLTIASQLRASLRAMDGRSCRRERYQKSAASRIYARTVIIFHDGTPREETGGNAPRVI